MKLKNSLMQIKIIFNCYLKKNLNPLSEKVTAKIARNYTCASQIIK